MSDKSKITKRNPRKYVPPERYCQHVYPPGEEKQGDCDTCDLKDFCDFFQHGKTTCERCRAISMEGSKMCYYHGDQERMVKQLAEAREIRDNPPNLKHGFYSKDKRECDSCSLQDGCEYYEPGKKVCDFVIKQDVDLDSLANIRGFAEEIVSSEIGTYRLLGQIVNKYPDNADLIDLKRKYGKTIMATLKDFASVKEKYEKTKGSLSWQEALLQG